MNTAQPVLSFVNGRVSHTVPVMDRGLHYGDGLFETILRSDNRLVLESQHLARLYRDAARLQIAIDHDALARDLAWLQAQIAGQGENGIVKIIVTRASAGRGYAANPRAGSNRLLQYFPGISWPVANRDGIRTSLSGYRLPENPALAGIKHLNRLDQVLACQGVSKDFYQEILLCDARGYVIEGNASNLFIVRQGELLTPVLDRAGVRGVMRDYLLDTLVPRLGLAAGEARLTLDDILGADELFVCNSVFGVWPVIALNVRQYAVGEITRQIQKELEQLGYAAAPESIA